MSHEVEIPEPLINQLLNNQLVLFLGSGASRGALSAGDKEPPIGNGLRDMICDKFFAGQLKDRPLAEVSDYVINEYDLNTLQSYLNEIFAKFEPATFHELIPLFPWHAIASTNYDLLIERAYERSKKKIRDIEVFVQNGDKIDIKLKKGHDKIAYIKLHGCISHHTNHNIPLIIAAEQLTKYSSGRDRLFERIRDLGRQCSIVFCGYSINDNNIREILFDLTEAGIDRPRYYLVKPDADEFFRRYWEKNRFSIINSTFKDFLIALQNKTSELGRVTASLVLPGSTTLNKFYRTAAPAESHTLIQFLRSDVTHIRQGYPVKGSNAKAFYSGYDEGWWPIEQKLDVYRDLVDSVIVEAVLKPVDRSVGVDLYVIKGAAGNGKTVALKRAAWDAANDYEQVVLYLNEGGALNKQCIQEIHDLTGKRIFVMVDHAALVVDELSSLLEFAKKKGLPLTVITTERDNEWNVRCGSLERYLKNEFSVGYLSTKEITKLIAKLDEHKCLGALQDKTPEQRVTAFVERAQRQLLVALHEVTQGKPFEVIIKDEYERIIPAEAQFLYLDICTLNRLGVPVRAGLIARVSGISFERFEKEFFKPLEYLVKTVRSPYLNDHIYEARHPHVAELVFSQALHTAEEIYEQIVRLLKGINVDYSSDSEAFTSLIRGRVLAEVFPSVDLGRKLFAVAHAVAKENPYVSHQEAVFEMAHASGNLVRAQNALEKALGKAPWDKSIQHTLANLKRKQANAARTDLERDKLRNEAKLLLRGMLEGGDQQQPFGLFTYAQLIVDQLEEFLEKANEEQSDVASDRNIAELVRLFEQSISQGHQKFADHEQFLVLEERFLTLIEKHEKAEKALARAFTINPRNEYIASRLSARYLRDNRLPEAKTILVKCLEANPSAKLAHLKLALLYMKHGSPSERNLILDHLRKSFTDGDSNLLAQFWYARELFVSGKHVDGETLFARLWDTPMSPLLRNEVRGRIKNEGGSPKRFRGVLEGFENSFGFIKSAGFPNDIYAQINDSDPSQWNELQRHDQVDFELAFTMKGPRALKLHKL